jgi:DNA-binding transcriptional LysR family regulator
VDVGSFTYAAKQLHMTQSGVSQHIGKLERYLGQELIVRKGKGFALTDSGERLNTEARAVLKNLQVLESSIGCDLPYEGEIRIMSPGSLGLKLYPLFLELQTQYPKLIIDYRFAPNYDIDQAVVENKIDLGFITQTSTLCDVVSTQIGEEELLLVTPADMKTLTWNKLQALGFISHPDAAHYTGLLLGANYPDFQHCDKLTKQGFSNQVSLVLEPVSLGLGFTVMPAHAVESYPKQHRIKIHQLPHRVSESIYAVEHRDKIRSKRIETILSATVTMLSSCQSNL